MRPFFHLIIVLAGCAGFAIASYIHHKKKAGEVLVCPIGTSCERVTHSEYSSFFGVPLEYLGMLYYAIIVFSYSAFLISPAFAVPGTEFVLLGTSILAVLFSSYLVFLQAFTLREWCTWCLISAMMSAVILAASFISAGREFVAVLAENYGYIVMLHLLAAAIGLGAANVVDVLFFRFLKDFRVNEEENGVLQTLSEVIWVALGAIVLSGIGILLARPEMAVSPKFLAKATIIGVIILNGALLNLFIAPNLTRINFGTWINRDGKFLRRVRRISFASGAVSIISWYAAFILGMSDIGASYGMILGMYVGIVGAAALASQAIDARWAKARG